MNSQDWLLIETEVAATGDEAVLAVFGDVDLATSNQLAAAIFDTASQPGIERIAVDLGEVGFLSSTGIGVLLRCKNELESAGIDFGVTRIGHVPQRTLELSGVANLLAIRGPASPAA